MNTKNASIFKVSGFNVTKVGDFVDGQRVDTNDEEKTDISSQ